MSPTQKLKHLAGSPMRFAKKSVEPGSINSSVFSLIIICMGAGTITIPYVFFQNGIILGTFFICVGAFLSLFTGYLIAYAAEKTGGSSYEEIAYRLYGKPGLKFVSCCNLCCNIGFLVSYIVLFKSLMPFTIEILMGLNNLPDFRKGLDPNWANDHILPDWIGNTAQGQFIWATLFSFLLLLPISLPRNLGALRFSSFMSFGISLFVVFSIFFCTFIE